MEERMRNPCPSGTQPIERGSARPYPTLGVGLEEEAPTSIPLRPTEPQVSSPRPLPPGIREEKGGVGRMGERRE